MFSKSKQTLKNLYNLRHQLQDIRVIGQLIFVVLVLLISWSGVKSIQTNYTLQKQITALKQENQVQQLKNDTVQLQNDYYNTNQYLELSAREDFGLGSPGETELLVPKSVALAHLAKLPSTQPLAVTTQNKPTYEKNFDAWVNFVLHRPSSSD